MPIRKINFLKYFLDRFLGVNCLLTLRHNSGCGCMVSQRALLAVQPCTHNQQRYFLFAILSHSAGLALALAVVADGDARLGEDRLFCGEAHRSQQFKT